MTHIHLTALCAPVALVLLSIAGLAACTSAGASTSPSSTVGPRPSATATETETAVPSASEAPSAPASEPADASAGPSAMATSIDPCQLVTADEVATLTGYQFGPPSSTTAENNSRICDYGQEGLGFDVIVVQAPDAATAKQQEPAFNAQLEKAATDAGIPNMELTELPGFEPGVDAAVLRGTTINGTPFGGVAFYALKGAVLLALTELTGPPIVSDAAIEAEAKTALGRIP
jgi:hypothetical protein